MFDSAGFERDNEIIIFLERKENDDEKDNDFCCHGCDDAVGCYIGRRGGNTVRVGTQDATAEQIYIVQNLVGALLDEVETGNLCYGLVSGYANARIRAVIVGQTNGHGYGMLSPIYQNAIRDARDIYLRPDVYERYEEYLRVLPADIISDVANGRDYTEARKVAYTRIYQSIDSAYTPREIGTDWCYADVLPVDNVHSGKEVAWRSKNLSRTVITERNGFLLFLFYIFRKDELTYYDRIGIIGTVKDCVT